MITGDPDLTTCSLQELRSYHKDRVGETGDKCPFCNHKSGALIDSEYDQAVARAAGGYVNEYRCWECGKHFQTYFPRVTGRANHIKVIR